MRFKGQMEFFFFGKKKPKQETCLKLKVQNFEANSISEIPTVKPEKREGFDQEQTAICVSLLNGLEMDTLAGQIKVVWNKRMRTTAGRAFWPEGKIELNPILEKVAPEEVRSTLLHELAHLVAYARAGRRRISAHGAEWRQACSDLGIPGERATHTLPLPGRTMQKKWRYTCPACSEVFDRVRKMKRYAGCYACCKAHNGGYYHKKFRFVETEISS